MRKTVLPLLLCLIAAATTQARVLSYSPYSDKQSLPAVQKRTNRYFVQFEVQTNYRQLDPTSQSGELVIYDSTGEEEPRVLDKVPNGWVAVREDAQQVPWILLQDRTDRFHLSSDGGRTWKLVDLPKDTLEIPELVGFRELDDRGGPFTRSVLSPITVLNADYPFAVEVGNQVWLVDAAGRAHSLSGNRVWGTNAAGDELLIGTGNEPPYILSLRDGRYRPTTADARPGWITPDGSVIQLLGTFITTVKQGRPTPLAPLNANDYTRVFAVPTADYSGAWVIQYKKGVTTRLSRYRAGAWEIELQWEDRSAPEVEALHAGQSGDTLLIQVHRERPLADQRLFIDPALAIWRVGQPAPAEYDELYMNEKPTKGFIHLDVDAVAAGDTFVFDSGVEIGRVGGGVIISPPAPTPPPPPGGGDVIQEWGVARAALPQKLVLPGIGRTRGAYDSMWLSDVIIRNASGERQNVAIRWVPTGGSGTQASLLAQATISLAPAEIRLIPDALRTLFGVESGSGAFFIEPERGVAVTSRTYSQSAKGTYGFAMNAIDLYVASSTRFPLTFAGAFNGPSFRTNMVLTDTGGRGAAASIKPYGPVGFSVSTEASLAAPSLGQTQMDDMVYRFGMTGAENGALVVKPQRGFVLASVFSIDNRTNDPTYYPPDIASQVVRTIGAIGHLDGANGSKFRSDLFFFNPNSYTATVTLQAKGWESPNTRTYNFSLRAGEARVIRDVLYTAFGETGMARLRFSSSAGITATARTYTVDPSGGTYGFIMPPLNNFQIAAKDDALEILGAVIDKRFRTNVALVDTNAFGGFNTNPVTIEVYDNGSRLLDRWQVLVASGGGMQMNDVFRERGIDAMVADGTPVLIRVLPQAGLVGAFATLIDNGTNDPSYLAAQLGAKPK